MECEFQSVYMSLNKVISETSQILEIVPKQSLKLVIKSMCSQTLKLGCEGVKGLI